MSMSPPSDASYYLSDRPSGAPYSPPTHSPVLLPPPIPSSTIVAPPLPAHLSLPLPSLHPAPRAAHHSHDGFSSMPQLDLPLPEAPTPSAPLPTPPPPPPRVPRSEDSYAAHKGSEGRGDAEDEVRVSIPPEQVSKAVKAPPAPTSTGEEILASLLHLVLGALLGLIFSLFAFFFNFCVPSLDGRPWRRNVFNIGVAIGVVTQASLLAVLGINIKRWVSTNILDNQ